jgi:hypothetical protein
MLHCNRESIARAAVFALVMITALGFSSDAAAQSLERGSQPETTSGGADVSALASSPGGAETICNESRVLGGFTLTLNGVDYDLLAGTSTWNYTLDWIPDIDPPILPVHLLIGVCNEIPGSAFLSSSPAGATLAVDPGAGIYGVRWAPVPGPPPTDLSFTIEGFYDVALVEFAVGEGDDIDRSTICGVSCVEICIVEITCPPDVTIGCSEGTDPSVTGAATVLGSCPPVNITYADQVTPGNCAGEWLITRTWTATDAMGVTDTCEQLITVVDELPPEITCPEPLNVQCSDDVPVRSRMTLRRLIAVAR